MAQVATRVLGKPDIEYREPFTAISGLRELRDGRVIVYDARDKTLQPIDLARGIATAVGRTAQGRESGPTHRDCSPSQATVR